MLELAAGRLRSLSVEALGARGLGPRFDLLVDRTPDGAAAGADPTGMVGLIAAETANPKPSQH